MTPLRRRSRAVYRVYSEDEYLAGADALPDWDAPVAEPSSLSAGPGMPAAQPRSTMSGCSARPAGASRERRLRRLAGAAALTGAVGTVGGMVGLAGMRAHAGNRTEIAEHRAPPPRMAVPRTNTSAVRVPRRQRHVVHLDRARRIRAGRRSRSAGVTLARTPRSQARHAPEISAQAVVASAAQGAPSETEARPGAQSEFGFER